MPDLTELFTWLDSCPTPHHVADMAARVLEKNGFERVTQLGADLPANGYLLREGSIHAWRQSEQDSQEFLIIGAPILVTPSSDGPTPRSVIHDVSSRLHADLQRLFDEAQSHAGTPNK